MFSWKPRWCEPALSLWDPLRAPAHGSAAHRRLLLPGLRRAEPRGQGHLKPLPQAWRLPRPLRSAAPLPQHRRADPARSPERPVPTGSGKRREGKQAPEPCRKMREAVCLPAGDTTLRCSAAGAAIPSTLLLLLLPAGPAGALSPPSAPLLRHPELSWRRAKKVLTLHAELG